MKPGNYDTTSRYEIGSIVYHHRGHPIVSTVGSKKWDIYQHMLLTQQYQLGAVPPELANRPDLISHIWYESTGLWWQIMLMNNLYDPFESLNGGDSILLPNL